ncbi:fatty acid desaturase 6 [Bufo bufo]|uniref:fatty acid desaturase 6 n=1 Tax=Bufo bufo TaxID=8384 RepID=UPI001ABE9908|nr:fatty acid desaturase 6 [Bufo bufo]XP_040291650.1 fatty acid desaturase 6 [Bufo bufo]XP_040291651.1 fatty acid desaturase 6 [Bufo bufo]XP_040291652.1 fatty acid desaturase 6 [Bufo bufo]XP_040291653.1 fatty acid desaturase 6 [Bufo bufo]
MEEEVEEFRPGQVNGRCLQESSGEESEILESSLIRRTTGDKQRSPDCGTDSVKEPLAKSENTIKENGASMRELSQMVQGVWKNSSWWERYGIDWSIFGLAFCMLPIGFLCLRSRSLFVCALGLFFLGLVHVVFTVKGGHMSSHRTLCQSRTWSKFWATFFMEVCSCIPVPCGEEGHVKLHHGYTNIIGLGDSSIWKVPYLSCGIYMFVAPLALPIITVLVGVKYVTQMPLVRAMRSLFCMAFGLWSHFQLLVHASGLSYSSALGCMFLSRALLAIPFIHVNIFQHIGLPMFSPSNRPHRLQLMTNAVLNLPRNPILDWAFGHSIINCHVEHHLFPHLSDNMCLKVKPLVSKYVCDHNMPYHEDTYMSRLHLFLSNYNELMVQAPPIAHLVEFH